jgi:hypothetical protein
MFPSLSLAALALALATHPARAMVAFQEDLSGTALPHGDLILPLPGTFEATHGDMLKFADGRLHPMPTENGHPIAPMKLPEVIRKDKTADLAYIDGDNGVIWAISGHISELGTSYLFEAAAQTAERPFDRPFELAGDDHHPAGLFKGVVEGRTYLIETIDGKFALVRVIEKSSVGLHIQYIYQPDGTAKFALAQSLVDAVPVKPLTAPPPAPPAEPPPAAINAIAAAPTGLTSGNALDPAAAPGASAAPGNPALPPVLSPPRPAAPKSIAGMTLRMNDPVPTNGVLEPTLDTFQRQRQLMIEHRLQIASAPAATPTALDQKSQAITDLGVLHADEAADTLAAQISYFDARKTKDLAPESVHPAYAALLKLGKAGTDAAIKALRSLDLSAPSDTSDVTQSPDYRARLLALVIRNNEGDDVADYLLKREAARTPDPRKRALFETLLGQRP